MKKSCLFVALLAMVACESSLKNESGEGELRVSFSGESVRQTRAGSEIPDTCDFIIDITDSKGKSVYSGDYGDCPEVLMVSSGSYYVKVVSEIFEKPSFDAPQYGDEQCVVVPAEGVADVRLICSQVNAGVRLDVDSDFLTSFPDGVLFLKSSKGKLMYGYSEERIAYFPPGQVSLILSNSGKDQVLMTRTLQAQEILRLRVLVASSSSSDISEPSVSLSLQIDTTRNWLSGDYTIGGSVDVDSEIQSPSVTITQAYDLIGEKDVWVSGYIVGGDLTKTSASFDEPFTSRTNILLGPKSSTSVKSSCMSIQLPSGDVREALNLVDNPSLLGKKVALKGDVVEAYFGIIGMKNVNDFDLQE